MAAIDLDIIVKVYPQETKEITVADYTDCNKIILVNDKGSKCQIQSHDGFKSLIKLLDNQCCSSSKKLNFKSHSWYVLINYFIEPIVPFVPKQYANTVKNLLRPTYQHKLNSINYVEAGDYVYWPHANAVALLDWRLFLSCNDIDLGQYIPLKFNKNFGDFNLFKHEVGYVKEDFNWLQVRTLVIDERADIKHRVLFTNCQNNYFADDSIYFLTFKTKNETFVKCKISPVLVYHRDDFIRQYVRDDINLIDCNVSNRFADIIHIDLIKLRYYDNKPVSKNVTNDYDPTDLQVTPSSIHEDQMMESITSCITAICSKMTSACTNLESYLVQSNFRDSDLVLVRCWKMFTEAMKNQADDYVASESNIKLFIDIFVYKVCNDNYHRQMLKDYLHPYLNATPDVFQDICDSHFFFDDTGEEVGATLACFALCLKDGIKIHKSNMLQLPNKNIVVEGFFKFIQFQGSNFIFDNKYYVYYGAGRIADNHLSKLMKETKTHAHEMHNFAFNNLKSVFNTAHGLFNTLTKRYSNAIPYLLQNTIFSTFIEPGLPELLPEHIPHDLIGNPEDILNKPNNMSREIRVFECYHTVFLKRQIQNLLSQYILCLSTSKCISCLTTIKSKLHNLLEEILSADKNLLTCFCRLLIHKNCDDILYNFQHPCGDIECSCNNENTFDKRLLKIMIVFSLFQHHTSPLILSNVALLFNRCQHLIEYFKQTNEIFKNIHLNIDYFVTNATIFVSNINDLLDYALNPRFDVSTWFNNMTQRSFLTVPPNSFISFAQFRDMYKIVNSLINVYPVWSDKLIIVRPLDTVNSWLERFYLRIFVSNRARQNCNIENLKLFLKGFAYFRIFTNFSSNATLIVSKFFASATVLSDYEKKTLIITGSTNSGKSSVFDVLSNYFMTYQERHERFFEVNQKKEKQLPLLKSQLFLVNELKETSSQMIKNLVDCYKPATCDDKFEKNQNYAGVYKVLIYNNDKLIIDDGRDLKTTAYKGNPLKNFDDAARTRVSQLFFDHTFENILSLDKLIESNANQFLKSIYYHIKYKKYPNIAKFGDKYKRATRYYFAHILTYYSNPKNGNLEYRTLVETDPLALYNKKVLCVYNNPVDATEHVINLVITKNPNDIIYYKDFERVIGMAHKFVIDLLHCYLKKADITTDMIIMSLKQKHKNRFHPLNNSFVGIKISLDENEFNICEPKIVTNLDI